MALIIKTTNPSGLLADIKKAIDNKTIDTWSYDSSDDFTHTPDQWRNEAWLRPNTDYVGELRFGIIGRKNVALTKEIYAIYHGRFIEMLLAHFDTKFTVATASAQKQSPDIGEKGK
jgi:hypothetical protein